MHIIDSRYELGGNSLIRLIRTTIFGKVIPLGNFHSGPGLRCLFVLFILHRLGRPLFYILARASNKSRIARRIYFKLR